MPASSITSAATAKRCCVLILAIAAFFVRSAQ